MDTREIKPEYLVLKSNSLVCANYDLSSQEQKIILMVASLIKPQDKEFYTCTLQIKDFMDLVGIVNKGTYKDIANITKGLMKKVFEIKENNTVLQLSWFSSVEYRTGTVELEFSPKLKPYLLEIQSLYTKYKLKNILNLKSKYSIRIYEILKCNAFKKHPYTIDIIELKKMTGGTKYVDNSNYRKRVLKPAQKEVNKLTDISFEFEEIRKGRRIIAIKFLIINKETNTIKNNTLNSDSMKDEICIDIRNKIQNVTKSTISLNTVFELIEKEGKEKIYLYIDNFHKFKTGKHNPVGFLIKAIQDEYPIPIEESNNYQQKPIQSTNFEQRTYDDDYFDSLIDNLRPDCDEETIKKKKDF